MSFMETRTDLSIINKALSSIAQQQLSGSLTDPINLNKNAGREANLWYKSTVRWLLTQHHWNMATKRVALVAATNDREAEWAAKYQPPEDMAFPVRFAPFPSGASVGYYSGLGFLLGTLYGRPYFRYEGNAIYGAIAGAQLEYVSFGITEDDFTDEFEAVLVTFLAGRLARSVAKDFKLAASYEQNATKMLNLAIAQNLNQQQPRYDQGVSEGELSRQGSYGSDDIVGRYR